MQNHKLIAIVHEHRWNLDGSSWGGFSVYPSNLRAKMFSEYSQDSFSQLVVAGDLLMSNPHFAQIRNSFLLKGFRRISNSRIRHKIDLEIAEKAIEILNSYDSKRPSIIYHVMNCFELPRPEFFKLAEEFNIILVTTLVDLQDFTLPENFSSKSLTSRRLAYEVNLRNAARLLSISEFLVSEAEDKLGISNALITHTSLGVDHISGNLIGQDIRNQIPFDEKYILFPAKAWKHKGHLEYIRAYLASDHSYKTIFVGDVSSIKSSIEKISHNSKVAKDCLFLNYVSDGQMRFLMANSAAVVLPSSYEGFGLPYMEAALLGIPVVGMQNNAILELLGVEGSAIAEVGNFPQIVALCAQAIIEPDMRKITNAQKKASDYTWSRAAARTLSGYSLALNSARER